MAWYDKVGDAGAGAAKGAATGALIGSVIPGVGTAIGAGAGALIGGAKGWLGAEGKGNYQDMLRADVDALRKGKGGLSGGQMNQMAAASKRDVGQQVGAMEQDIAQRALSEGGGYGASGSYSKLIGDLTDKVGESAAAARFNLQKASLAMAQDKYDKTMARLNQQRIEAREDAKDAMDYLLGDDLGDLSDNLGQLPGGGPVA